MIRHDNIKHNSFLLASTTGYAIEALHIRASQFIQNAPDLAPPFHPPFRRVFV